MVVNMDNFEAQVLDSEIPVVVDFYADWCGPCKMMSPIVEKAGEELAGKVKVVKCNVDDNMALASKYGIMSIPNFVLFKGGEVAANMVGATSLDMFKSWIEGAI